MNQLEIERILDRRLAQSEISIEKKLRKAQQVIQLQLMAMYQQYERNGDLTYAEMQKYNRLEKQLQSIAEALTAEYQAIVQEMEEVQQGHYLLTFLLTAYLFDQFMARPVFPTKEMVAAAFLLLLSLYKLPRFSGESETIEKIGKVFRDSVERGESKEAISKKFEKLVPAKGKQAESFAKELAQSLFERLEKPVNDSGIKIPTRSEIREAVKIDGLTLAHFLTVKRNRLVSQIRKEMNTALKKNETVSQMSKRVNEQLDKDINSLRLLTRNISDRVRAIALGSVENQIAHISDVRGMWLSKRDGIVRKAHQILDGNRTDRKGYFHYMGMKAKAPRMWGIPSMDNYCRCKKLTLLDFKVPVVAEGIEYNNKEYSRQLTELAEKKVEEKGITYEKAFTEALKEIPEPQGNMPFVAYEEWLRLMGVKGSLDGIT